MFQSSKLLAVIVVSHLIMSIPGNNTIMMAVLNPKLYSISHSNCVKTSPELILINISHILYVGNYAINFLLYCLGNKDVRKETFSLLKEWKDVLHNWMKFAGDFIRQSLDAMRCC